MATQSIGGLISEGFIARLGTSGALSSESNRTSALPQDSSAVKTSLRAAASRLSVGVQNLNSGISAINLVRDSLEKLDKIVGKIITLADAAERASGSSERQNLNTQSTKLAREFVKVLQDSTAASDEADLFTVEGLKEGLTALGVDPEQSDRLAQLIGRIQKVDDESPLADQTLRGQRPIPVAREETTSVSNNTLGSRTDVAIGGTPSAPVLADVNGDTHLDLVTLKQTGYAIEYRLNNGSGSFGSGVTIANLNTDPFYFAGSIAAGDFNEDGRLDIVASSQFDDGQGADPLYFLNIVTSNISEPDFFNSLSASVSGLGAPQVGDFDGDGNVDVISTNSNSFSVGINRGDGLGGLNGPTGAVTTVRSNIYSVGNLNGDSRSDVIVSPDTAATTARVLLGSASSPYVGSQADVTVDSTSGLSRGSAIADVDGDGTNDFIDLRGGHISVVAGNGNGTFQTHVTYAYQTTLGASRSLAVSDLTGDGFADLVVAHSTGVLEVYKNSGTGTFSTSATYAIAAGTPSVTIGDVNGDGLDDVVVGQASAQSVGVLLQVASSTPGESVEERRPLELPNLFSSGRTILTKGEARLVGEDARALRKQIRHNQKVLEDLTTELGKTLELTRSIGLGFLDVANSSTVQSGADAVVRAVQSAIRTRGGDRYSAQIQNIEGVAAAALLSS
jgi:FG-GAP-like repeat